MKTVVMLSVVALQIVTSIAATQKQETFAIYLLASSADARPFAREQDRWKNLQLASEPIISEADVLAYDFSKHALRLRPEALKRLPRPTVIGTPFVVVVNGERIYPGAFYTSASSIPFGKPVIVVDRRSQGEATDTDVVLIERAYPPSGATGEDLRSDKRVRGALGKLKKLASL